MKAAHGSVFKYGDNVDTDVIIPARYLNSSDPKELATHCMEDIDKDFVKNVHVGDIIVANKSEILSTAPKSRVILVINKQNIHIIRIGGENGCRIKLFYQGCKKNCNISNKCSYTCSFI